MLKEITFATKKREELINITADVEEIVASAKVEEGICLVYVPHSSASIVINENEDPMICDDILEKLRKSIPQGIWRHDRLDGNADAHIKSSLIGSSVTIPIDKGRMMLGRYQAIMFIEFSGPRPQRRYIVKIMKG
jgi:secondary thiamine-phosphate synthase enzyme